MPRSRCRRAAGSWSESHLHKVSASELVTVRLPTNRELPLHDASWRQRTLSYPTCIMQDMSQPSAHRHHAIDYVELTVTDLEQAKRFYSEAFGWRFNDYGPEYAGIQSPQGGSAPEVGGLTTGQEVRAGGPFVLLYSTDLNRSVEAVKNAGGQVVNGPYEFPGGRRFHFTDPSGNELGVWAEA
jgi:predicted enzyme related to lactoylglutathione lyase